MNSEFLENVTSEKLFGVIINQHHHHLEGGLKLLRYKIVLPYQVNKYGPAPFPHLTCCCSAIYASHLHIYIYTPWTNSTKSFTYYSLKANCFTHTPNLLQLKSKVPGPPPYIIIDHSLKH